MVDSNLFIPLSPPSSPRMSAYSTTPAENEWQNQDIKALDNGHHSDSDMALLQAEVSGHNYDLKRPLLRAHKSFPYSLKTDSSMQQTNGSSSPTSAERITISNIEDMNSSEMPTVTFGGSAPASPVSRLTPPSPSDAVNGDKAEPQGDEIITEETEGSGDQGVKEEEKPPISAAELRAQKRKMKRFRLTHNQTRFLMSEFTRQAHPDAAHRERLAREIPGLSPRQVQVWFQNRRAKLKRLTSDDRERMMRSRQLPEDFDMTQALHSPFGTSHGLGTPLTSPGSYQPGFPGDGMMRPLTIDTLRRGPMDSLSPTGISPAFGGFTFTPPQSATDTLSPVSTGHDGSHFGFPPSHLEGSPRRSNPFSMSISSAPTYAAHNSIPRLDRISRSRAESLSTPLRASMSYNGESNLNGSSDSHHMGGSSIGDDQNSSRAYSSSVMPYGLGYSYSPIPGFQASSGSRMRSFSSHVPRRIELSTHFTPSRSSNAPQTATFPTYTSSPLVTPQSFAMPQLSAPHHITTFQNSYLRNDSGQSDQYPGVGAVLGEVIENSNQDNESDHGSVQLQQSY